jgi:selenocysteine-specific elongation factor
MLAGVGGIDLVLLVVAADESIKPQTREHLDICRLLGIRMGMVAITKSDLVPKDILDLVRLELQEYVAGSFLEGAPIVAVSARTGEGLETLRAELRRLALDVPPKPLDLPFRLPIDRAFVMKGFGAVVTGTLIAGKIEKESEVEVFPLGRRVRVRGIEVHNQPADCALAGQRTALNLAGIEAQELARGMVLASPALFEATSRLDAAVSLLVSARPLKNRARVHFHCGTAEMVAEVVLLDTKELAPGGRTYAQLRLAARGLFLPGDRFVIRQFSPLVTIGGGVVLDNQPPKHRPADPEVCRFLEVMDAGNAESRLELLTEEVGEASLSKLVARTGWAPEEVQRVGKLLELEKRLLVLGQPPNLFVHAHHFQALARVVVTQLQEFHAANPLTPGIIKEELRGRLALPGRERGSSPSPPLFKAVLQWLDAQRQVELRGETVVLAGRQIQLSAEEAAAKEQISRGFERAGLAVPGAKEVLGRLPIDRVRAEKILQILLKEGTLVRVADDLIFHRAALEKLREILAQRKAVSNRINVTIFKELTGLTRKYAIPLLEYLDRERLTRREGDERIIL